MLSEPFDYILVRHQIRGHLLYAGFKVRHV